MGMTNKQYQGFIRSILALIDKMLQSNPDNDDLKEIRGLLQSMLEDGD